MWQSKNSNIIYNYIRKGDVTMENEIDNGLWILLFLIFVLFLNNDTVVIELGDDKNV